ncbi:cupin domain-containing protein [Nocardioides sp. NPDC006303]|uniref:cupin domain-containing protein n=1 Tax=Nocardioides sp. NPDC006303 TaxID=3156747 RepID=UPI0033AB8B74
MIPKAGETRLVLLQIPPDSWALRDDFDAAAAGEEFVRLHPEMAAAQEPDSPGMHRTDSIDYIIVLDGEIHLEVDDQQEVLLKEHDVVVQLGARHAWRNKADKPALLAVVLVGAEREA